jgi:hypothetical protein
MLTDSNGQAVFTSVQPGSHQATASKSGYSSQTKTFTVMGDMTEDFALTPTGGPVSGDYTMLILVAAALGALYLFTRKKS